MKIIQAFNAQAAMLARFKRENEDFRRFNLKISNLTELSSPSSEVLGIITVTGLLVFGSQMVFSGQGDLSAADFLAYIAIFSQIIPPLKASANTFSRFQRSKAAILRVLEVIDLRPSIKEQPNAQCLEQFQESIEFRNVCFSYDEKEVLSHINFTIKKGETVALVGTSGSGKSTLADLLPRFLEPTSGSILIDGIDIRQYTLESLRNQIGIVSQEAILFNDTASNNIRLGNPNATQDDIEAAAKIAHAHEFLKEKGYDTPLGERGGKLSGGQKQRLSIARSILKKPAILILDEATSALDSNSEKLVQNALEQVLAHTTALIIAHRLSTIQNADKIIVLEQGKICEIGTHSQLIAQKGIYSQLSQMQHLGVK
jgi:ATP-binding cassette, subfamily B, bacterial MsbA